MTVNGIRDTKTCLTLLEEGMIVESEKDRVIIND
jgi:hypothetical protein